MKCTLSCPSELSLSLYYTELLWTAPEQIRNSTKKLTKEGDIYAIGIIMQEVVLRGPPFEQEYTDNDTKGNFGHPKP